MQTFKDGVRKLKEGSVDTKLSRFLLEYRITPQSSTGISPAELMFGRRLRTLFDNMHPDLDKKVCDVQLQQAKGHDVRAKAREFVVGDLVYAQNYGQGPKWLPGEIVKKHGSALFTVQLKGGRKARKHTDHAEVADKDHGTPDDNDVLEYPAREDTDQSDTNIEPPESTEPPEQSDPGEQVATLHLRIDLRIANLIPTKITTWMTTSTKTLKESSDKTHLDLDVQVDPGILRIGMVKLFIPTELNNKASLLCYLC